MNWQDASEITCGLLLDGKLAANAIRADLFFPPYDAIIKAKLEGKDVSDIIEDIGLTPVQACIDASHSVKIDTNWIKILEQSKNSRDAGITLQKIGKKLQDGEHADLSKVSSILSKVVRQTGTGYTPLSDISAMEVPFIKTGFKAIDDHLGGIPEIGQIIIGGPPGVGKTSFVAALACCFAAEHPGKIVAIHTLEMIKEELKMRIQEVHKLPADISKRIWLDDDHATPEDVINKASAIPNEQRGLIIIDFSDLQIDGETTESAMSHIYRTYMIGAKALRCPIIVLAQLNRTYNGGLPRPTHLRWTGLAEALGWMILMLYNPSKDWFSDDDEPPLPIMNGLAYVLCWKSRGGFRVHKDDSPGAIQIPFKGEKGWHYAHPGKWFSLQKSDGKPQPKKGGYGGR